MRIKRRFVFGGICLLIITTAVMGYVAYTKKNPVVSRKSPMIYLALGDSVAAGQGLATDADSSACYRTKEAYPNQVAKNVNYELSNMACSGASVLSGVIGSQTVNGASLPAQVEQVKLTKPKLITLTVGANDVNWLAFMMQCYIAGCGSNADSQLMAVKIDSLKTNVTKVFDAIAQAKQADTTVLVTGYYYVFPATSRQCTATSIMTDSKLAWMHDQTDLLNKAIQDIAAKYSFARFVPIDFAGHEVCTNESWVQTLNDKAPFHPTADGQAAYVEAITQAYRQ